jgi:hypothetical protein
VSTATFDAALNSRGFPAHGDFGNSFVKISLDKGAFSVADYFTMFDVAAENSRDDDLGSGGPLVLPEMTDVDGRTLQLAVGAGKDRNIYLVKRNNMGKFDPTGNRAIYQELPKALKGSRLPHQ